MEKDKVKAKTVGKMVNFIQEIGKMEKSMVMDFGSLKMVILTQDNGEKEWLKDLESYQRKMVQHILVNFKNFKNQVMEDKIL